MKTINFESATTLKKVNDVYRDAKGVNSWTSTDVIFQGTNDENEGVYVLTTYHTREDENGVVTSSWTTTDWFYLKDDGSFRFQYSTFVWKTGRI